MTVVARPQRADGRPTGRDDDRALALLLALGNATGQPADAWSRPDDAIREYVAAFNAGEPQMREFLEKSADPGVPLEQRVARYRDVKKDFGTIALRAVTSSAGGPTALIVNGRGVARHRA